MRRALPHSNSSSGGVPEPRIYPGRLPRRRESGRRISFFANFSRINRRPNRTCRSLRQRSSWRGSGGLEGKFLRTLQPTNSQAVEAAPLCGDEHFVVPKTREESLQMRILNPVHEPGWDHVVALHRDASCFHTSAWAKVLHETYGHSPFYLQFSCGRRLAALVPVMEVRSPFTGRRGVCLPFSDACEPLVFDPEAVGLVRDRLVCFAHERRWKHVEIRGGKSFPLASRSTTKFYG